MSFKSARRGRRNKHFYTPPKVIDRFYWCSTGCRTYILNPYASEYKMKEGLLYPARRRVRNERFYTPPGVIDCYY